MSALAASSHGDRVRSATRFTAAPKPRFWAASTTVAQGAACLAAAADPSADALSTTHTSARDVSTWGASEARQSRRSARVLNDTTATVTTAGEYALVEL